MGSHSVTCHPTELTFPPVPQTKLVLDLDTPDGCKLLEQLIPDGLYHATRRLVIYKINFVVTSNTLL